MPTPDPLLDALAPFLESEDGVEVTLLVSGAVFSGRVVSPTEFARRLAKSFKKSKDAPTKAAADRLVETLQAEADDFVHLVETVQWGASARDVGRALFRVRRDAVQGLALGSPS